MTCCAKNRHKLSPEQRGNVKNGADENDHHGEEEKDKENDKSPRVTGSDVTHAVYRSTHDVTRICADVTDTAAVAVSLNSHNRHNR